ncbi:MAG: hypothetical protein R3190_08375, partial [Thermoanaerobaculia bacterium]|nr:hypothetical protein [Thermoanaerobaculia bacterium]
MRPWRAAPTTCVLALLASSCAPPEPARVVDSAGAAPCTETGAAEIPPAGTRLATSYAENFEVHYEPGYKRLVVHAPWGGRTRSRTYYLVPCGSRPDLPADADVLRIPPGRVATTSTTQLPHFVALDVVDHLAGHNRLDFIYDETLRARAAAGELREVGDGVRLEPETLVDLEPDLVFATTIGNPDLDPLGLLGRIGSPAVVDASFMEASPLGRAEW